MHPPTLATANPDNRQPWQPPTPACLVPARQTAISACGDIGPHVGARQCMWPVQRGLCTVWPGAPHALRRRAHPVRSFGAARSAARHMLSNQGGAGSINTFSSLWHAPAHNTRWCDGLRSGSPRQEAQPPGAALDFVDVMSSRALVLALLVSGACAARGQRQLTTPGGLAPLCQRLPDAGPYSAAYLCLGVPQWALVPALWTPLSISVNCSAPTVRAARRAPPRRAVPPPAGWMRTTRMHAPVRPSPRRLRCGAAHFAAPSAFGGIAHPHAAIPTPPAVQRCPTPHARRPHLSPAPAPSTRCSPRRRGSSCSASRRPCGGAGLATSPTPPPARSACRPSRTRTSPSAPSGPPLSTGVSGGAARGARRTAG